MNHKAQKLTPERTLLIGKEGTSNATVVHEADTLDIKPVKILAGRLLPGSSLVPDHISYDVESCITRQGRVHMKK